MLPYHNPIKKEGRVLSVDNIVWSGYIPDPRNRDFLLRPVMERLYRKYGANITHWDNFRIGNFRTQTRIELPGGSSFWVGLGLNQGRTEWGHVRLDANPNKVADTSAFCHLQDTLRNITRVESRKIMRFDLAVDLAVPREQCYLLKDSRVYQERRHGKEWTQYLGSQSSHVGRVKLYNKQAESHLSYPLTRLELTLDPSTPYEKIQFPKIYYLNNMQQMSFEDLKITDTDNFVLNALLQGCGNIKQLGRKERAKMERLMEHYVTSVTISPEDYAEILRQVQSYV